MNDDLLIAVLTHGRFGEELVKSTEMIVGKQNNIITFSLLPSVDPEEFYKDVHKRLSEKKADRILFLVDIFGGSPGIVASRLSRVFEGRVVSGVNLPMLIEILNQPSTEKLDEIIYKGIEASKSSTLNMSQKMES